MPKAKQTCAGCGQTIRHGFVPAPTGHGRGYRDQAQKLFCSELCMSKAGRKAGLGKAARR